VPPNNHISLTGSGVAPPHRRFGYRGFYSRGKTVVKDFPEEAFRRLREMSGNAGFHSNKIRSQARYEI